MIILIISEARTGSVNLMTWLRLSTQDYVVLTEPYEKKSPDFVTDIRYNTDWIDINKNYIINEKYFPGCGDLSKLINISDITLALYRENKKEQIESYIVANVTDSWRTEYNGNCDILKNIDTKYLDKKIYFENLKKEFKGFIEFHDLKSFTYEDLYFRNGINEFKQYFEIVRDVPFPFGKKYRSDIQKERLI